MLNPTTPQSVDQMKLPWGPCTETYGVEIEVLSKGTRDHIANEISYYGFAAQSRDNAIPDHPYDMWYVKTDATIISKERGYYPAELVSPILTSDTIDDNIEVACEVLEYTESKANKSCGLHIHVGTQWLGLEQKKRIAWQYARNERTIDQLINKSRSGSNNTTCQGWYDKASEWLQSWLLQCNNDQVLRAIINPRGKYYKVNLYPWDKETIEFRHHHGTVDCEAITQWKNFVIAFCIYSVSEPIKGSVDCDSVEDLLTKLAAHTTQPSMFVEYYMRRAKESS